MMDASTYDMPAQVCHRFKRVKPYHVSLINRCAMLLQNCTKRQASTQSLCALQGDQLTPTSRIAAQSLLRYRARYSKRARMYIRRSPSP